MNANRWIADLRSFFGSRADDLATVLGATGCREGWIQAEIYRFFKNKGVTFLTNYLALPSPNGRRNRKADLCAYASEAEDAALLLIGEVKVYGEKDFFEKNLCGGSITEVERAIHRRGNSRIENAPWARQLVQGPSLLADYFRLVDYDAKPDAPARLLILVVRRSSEPDRFGQLLQTIQFERPGTEILRTEHAWVKLWPVTPAR